MKNLIFMLLLAGSIGGVYAQNAEKKDKFSPDTPLFEELTNASKRKGISTTGCHTVTASASTARMMPTA